MQNINQTAVVPYTCEQMFKLVNNIESYPAFLPWCRDARVLSSSDTQVRATIYMAKGLLQHQFTTHNTLEKYNSIRMQLVEGPFKHLEGEWIFRDIGNDRCEITFFLEFEFAANILAKVLEPLFYAIVAKMVDAFRDRAQQVYGM